MNDTAPNKDILDSREEILKIDEQNILDSVEELPQQCTDAYKVASQVQIPEEYKKFDHVIMTGMGGSGLGARIIQSVYCDQLKTPLIRVNDYHLPPYAGKNSLVIISSYSGNTEETIQNAQEATERGCKWMAIGVGGELEQQAIRAGVPFYKINPRFNPSNQPRMAIGYSVVGQLVLTAKIGLFNFIEEDVEEIAKVMMTIIDRYRVEVGFDYNAAKQLVGNMLGKNIFYISGEHLTGAIHTVNNQLNENAKTFSADYHIPELNHHLLEAMKHPYSNPENLFLFFANSTLYSDRIKKRFAITKDIVQKHNINTYEYVCTTRTKLTQAFELIQFGAYVNLYLSILYGQNPSPIPWVDYFKEQMSQ